MVDLEGLEYYEVGGAPRDELLGREPNDRDYVIVGATPEEMAERGFEQMVGEAFPVFLHPESKDEWALARTEEKSGVGYKGFEVKSDPSVSLEEDLERRDLTINAMARDPRSGEIVDPFGGQEDLEAGVVRHVSDAFAEDPLRVLRAARFAARFDFEVAPETMNLMQDIAHELEHISNERIDTEVRKALRQADSPRKFFDIALESGALGVMLPEVAELDEVPAGPEDYHSEGSAFEHTMRVLENAHELRPNDERLLLAALFHDIGKTVTPDDVLPHHYKHAKRGKQVAKDVASRLEMSNESEGVMWTAARFHDRMYDIEDLREATLLRMVDRLRDDYEVSNPEDEAVVAHVTPDELVDLADADSRGRVPSRPFDREPAAERFKAAARALDEVTGGDVIEKYDIESGEKVSEVLLQERISYLKELEESS